jgi:hypothetical protein
MDGYCKEGGQFRIENALHAKRNSRAILELTPS